MPASLRASAAVLMLLAPRSRLPKLIKTSFTFDLSLISAGVIVPPLNMPMYEKVSRLAIVTALVWMAPMERPAIARWFLSATVRKLASTQGINSAVMN